MVRVLRHFKHKNSTYFSCYYRPVLLILLLVVMAMPGQTVTAVCMSSNAVCQWLGV